ncbi:MAG: phosphomethylpyrimidine synthase ThiC [Clostridiales bacterium]|nr:phosphomethylpyrimidine synthase ThiC [Clostridiales bacterium]MCF8021308.1 phosphomethylpyrimidine synthase ThiC [Clostridiales bacterium]
MTQMDAARKGQITAQMKEVAEKENVSPEFVRAGIEEGTIVIPGNIRHSGLKPIALGKGLKTKVNANIGTSTDFPETKNELVKLDAALKAGADSLMDLSTGGDLDANRRAVISHCPVMVGTVPVYQAMIEAREKYGAVVDLTGDDLFKVIEKHIEDGVDFLTVHCGVTRNVVEILKKEGRVTDIVSRGGAFLAGWMVHHGHENPLYQHYDRLLEMCIEHDVTLSLGDGLRPGCINDASDQSQIAELVVLGELVERARRAGVQVMVEGPGHVPLNEVAANVQMQKSICKGAPFYVLGPLVTDVCPGYDHINASIGGAVAAMTGADFLCYVTPAEHLGLPTAEDVREGVMASRLAGHAADIVQNIPGAKKWDESMSTARKELNWKKQKELALDPEKFDKYRQDRNPEDNEACTMCGEYCALKIIEQYLK